MFDKPRKIVATSFGKAGRLLIMLTGQKSCWQRSWKWVWVSFSMIVMLPLFVFLYEPPSPDGTYYDPYMACGHGRWIFNDGKVFAQGDNEPPQYSGAYYKSGGRWVCGSNPTNMAIIKPSLLGVTVTCKQFQQGRRFLFRDCFSWAIDSIDWIPMHLLP